VVFRGNYWRDRNTRVLQPEADFSKTLPSGTTIGGHYLLDTITSASAAAGGGSDKAFTELRNEFGVNLGQQLGPVLMTAGYSYSSESDYWAHLITTGASVDLFQHNTTIGVNLAYGLNSVAQRMGATLYNPLGGLQTANFIASFSQVLSPTTLLSLEFDAGVIGFGSEKGKITGTPNADTGFQSNPYRLVSLGGMPVREVVPFQRVRMAVAGNLYLYFPIHSALIPYVAFRPMYRFYWDDWGVKSHAPELRTHVPIGPVELRVTGRFYTQSEASFFNDVDGRPLYTDLPGTAPNDPNRISQGKPCTGCYLDASRAGRYFTADPKLSAFRSMFLELRVLVSLRALRRIPRLPMRSWLSAGVVEVSYGHYFNSDYAHTAFGDAEVAGLSLTFPL
jgi:hypothetical protein